MHRLGLLVSTSAFALGCTQPPGNATTTDTMTGDSDTSGPTSAGPGPETSEPTGDPETTAPDTTDSTDPTDADMGTGDSPEDAGDRVVVYGYDGRTGRLDLLDPETGTWQTLEPAPLWDNDIVFPTAEPNGTRIAWLTPGSGLYVADAFDPAPDLLAIADNWFRWSNDGTWIAYVQAGTANYVAASGVEMSVYLGATVGSFAYEVENLIEFAPDDTRLAWASDPGDGGYDVAVTDLATGETTIVAPDLADVRQIDWLDDETLLYSGTGGLFSVAAQGGTPDLIAAQVAYGFQLRPGATHVLGPDCILYPIAGGTPVPTVPMDFAVGGCLLSPSGDYVVVTGSSVNQQALAITAVASGTIDTLVTADVIGGYQLQNEGVVVHHTDLATGEQTITRFDNAAPHDEFPIVTGTFDDVWLFGPPVVEVARSVGDAPRHGPLPGYDEYTVATVAEDAVTTHSQSSDGTNTESTIGTSGLTPTLHFDWCWDPRVNTSGVLMGLLLSPQSDLPSGGELWLVYSVAGASSFMTEIDARYMAYVGRPPS